MAALTLDEALYRAAIQFLPHRYGKALRLLEEEPMTNDRLVEKLVMNRMAGYQLLYRLKTLKVVCIVDYIPPNGTGTWTKVWGLGDKDKAPPKPKTSSEKCKEWRRRKKVVRLGVMGL